MYIELYLKKPKEVGSGYYPEELDEKDQKKYIIENLDEALSLGEFFLESGINDYCNSYLGPYDVCIFNSEQCKLLLEWISNNRNKIVDSGLENLFKVIEEYSKEAVKLDTGIEIEV